jgi:hypothetical protein
VRLTQASQLNSASKSFLIWNIDPDSLNYGFKLLRVETFTFSWCQGYATITLLGASLPKLMCMIDGIHFSPGSAMIRSRQFQIHKERRLKRTIFALMLIAFLSLPLHLIAQSGGNTQEDEITRRISPPQPDPGEYRHKQKLPYAYQEHERPFSRIALGASVGPMMGTTAQIATDLNEHFNLRGTGSYFNYTIDNITESGFTFAPQLNLVSAGASLDYYPFARLGLRLSPGVLLYNTNQASSNFTSTAGETVKLNGNQYYVASPVTGVGAVTFYTQKPAFTMTTGWGNMIPHKGGHFSFPFEIGAAFVGEPNLSLAFTGGSVCFQSTTLCATPQNVLTYPQVQTDLNAQIAKYRNDLEPFRFYPIVSFGVAYSFRIR